MSSVPESTRLRLILFRAAYNLPVSAGIAQGIFARHGLELEIVYTRGSAMTIEALASGDCALGVLGADDVVYEVETHSRDLFIACGLHAGILQLVARPGLRELAGCRLGADDPASGFALVAHRILARLGVARTAYTTIAAGGHEPRARALEEGRIDVALSTPPFSLALAARGFPILARAVDHLPHYLASCVVARRTWAAAHPELLAAYLAAYRESLAWILEPGNHAAATALLAHEFALPAPLAAASFAAISAADDGLYRDARIDMAGLATVLELRVAAGLLGPIPPPLTRYL